MSRQIAVCAFALALGCAVVGSAARSDSHDDRALRARLDRLEAEIIAGEDVRAIKKLQRAYGYYLDKGMWEDLADLFSADAVANYPAGVFVGAASIRQHLYLNVGGRGMGEIGLGEGRLYDHMNIQPVVHLDPGGQSARGRWRALAMIGSYGERAIWAEGVYEIRYAKQNGIWRIARLDYYAGFGAPYQTGWAAPAAPAAAPGAAPAAPPPAAPPVRTLAHPPDQLRDRSCEGFPKACIAPFHYGNPGTSAAADVWSVAPEDTTAVARARGSDDLRRRVVELGMRAERLRDAQEIERLQRIYGYYLDRALWDEVAGLFAVDGSIEMDQRGVYVGRDRIRQFLGLLGPQGLSQGRLNDHIQLQPIVDVAPDGTFARLRSRELAMTGEAGSWGKWSEGTYENTFVKQDGVWKFKSLHFYPTFITDYDKGWALDAEPAPGASSAVPPDRGPTEVYAIYPKVYVPPFHYANPVTGAPPRYPAPGAPAEVLAAKMAVSGVPPSVRAVAMREVDGLIERAERAISTVKDREELENLESAYGYYLDKNLWSELSALFSENASLELAQRGVYVGREHIRSFLLNGLGHGHEGPMPGMLGNHLQLQPVIDIAPDGRSAKIRARVLQQMAFGSRAAIAAGVYENEAVKVNGIWLLAKDHAFNTLAASYSGGWVRGAQPQPPGPSAQYPPDAPPTVRFEMFPSVYAIPFHYVNPVTGR